MQGMDNTPNAETQPVAAPSAAPQPAMPKPSKKLPMAIGAIVVILIFAAAIFFLQPSGPSSPTFLPNTTASTTATAQTSNITSYFASHKTLPLSEFTRVLNANLGGTKTLNVTYTMQTLLSGKISGHNINTSVSGSMIIQKFGNDEKGISTFSILNSSLTTIVINRSDGSYTCLGTSNVICFHGPKFNPFNYSLASTSSSFAGSASSTLGNVIITGTMSNITVGTQKTVLGNPCDFITFYMNMSTSVGNIVTMRIVGPGSYCISNTYGTWLSENITGTMSINLITLNSSTTYSFSSLMQEKSINTNVNDSSITQLPGKLVNATI